jgi:hypothetical protein
MTTEIQKRIQWVNDPKNEACESGKVLVASFQSVEELYDNIPSSRIFLYHICYTKPELARSIIQKCIEALLPIDSKLVDLIEARTAAFDPATTNEQLERYKKILGSKRGYKYLNLKGQAKWLYKQTKRLYKQYYRIIYYMISWRLGLHDTRIALNIQVKISVQMKALGVDSAEKVLLAYMYKICPFEEWSE